MKSSKTKEKKLNLQEHLKEIRLMLDIQIARIESIYDQIDLIAKENTVEIKGHKYIRVSRFRFEVKHSRQKLLKDLRNLRKKWKQLEDQA